MSDVKTITYVTYQEPGLLFPETSGRQVDHRDPQRAADEAPTNAYAFRFHDVVTTTVEVDGKPVETRSVNPRNVSKTYYIDAKVLDAATVAALPGDHDILLSNMLGNRWEYVLLCRPGNFQPYDEETDVLVYTRVSS
jgi:hypothetical protein